MRPRGAKGVKLIYALSNNWVAAGRRTFLVAARMDVAIVVGHFYVIRGCLLL